MGTYLKIAPQNADVTFTSIDASEGVFNQASGSFSGSFEGDGSGLTNVSASIAVSASYSLTSTCCIKCI